jgi:hypothetical protein
MANDQGMMGDMIGDEEARSIGTDEDDQDQ